MLPRKILKVETKICAIWGILEENLKKSSTLMFMMNVSFVPSICIHRSTIFIFIEKNLNISPDNNCWKLNILPFSHCVCVCVERERENCILSQTCPPQNTSVSTPNCLSVCARILRFKIRLFSFFCLVLFCVLFVCFGFFLRMHHQSIKTKKCQRTIFLSYLF